MHHVGLQVVTRITIYGRFETEQSAGQWALLWATGAFGGVRVVAQFYFLAKTRATTHSALHPRHALSPRCTRACETLTETLCAVCGTQAKTSATSLAMSGIAMQALTIIIGDTPPPTTPLPAHFSAPLASFRRCA